jgi:hypothetical protein
MVTAVVGSTALKMASDNASQTSAKANSGQDVSGGGLGKLGSAVGAVAGAAYAANNIPTSGGGTIQQPLYNGQPAVTPNAFYGGESCDQIRAMRPVKIVGAPKQILSSDEKSFYKNVVVPRKKV